MTYTADDVLKELEFGNRTVAQAVADLINAAVAKERGELIKAVSPLKSKYLNERGQGYNLAVDDLVTIIRARANKEAQ